MASGPESAELMRQATALFAGGVVAGMSDVELLGRFASRAAGDAASAEAAFGAIVERHGRMVLGVCRRALCDPRDAEDAFQATFLVLARKADAVRVDDSLGRWLYGVSRRVAAKARARSARRLARESIGAIDLDAIGVQAPDPAERAEARVVVLEELARLPDPFREAVALCDLEGCTHEEAARRLGRSVGTIKSRLSRGRARLRDRLSRRGLAVPALLPIVERPSAALLAATTRSAVRFATQGAAAGAVPAGAAVLAIGVLRAMAIRTICTLATVLTAASVLVASATAWNSPPPEPPPVATFAAQEPDPAEGEARSLEVRVVDAETGDPLPGAEVVASLWRPVDEVVLGRPTTDGDGQAVVSYPSDAVDSLRVTARADGHIPMGVYWQAKEVIDGPPGAMTIELPRGEPIGGVVQDERGRPIAGATVVIWLLARGNREGRLSTWATIDFPVRTDAEGRWRADYLPPDLPEDAEVRVRLEHPGFVSEPSGFSRRMTPEQARSMEVVEEMAGGLPVAGRVVDAEGRALVGARVALAFSQSGGDVYRGQTDDEGRFRFGNVPARNLPGPGEARRPWRGLLPVTVEAEGYATAVTMVPVGDDDDPPEIALRPGTPLGVRVVDPEGRPIDQAIVTVDELGDDPRAARISWQGLTDADGRVAWPGGPAEGEVRLRVDRSPFLTVLRRPVSAGAPEAKVVLRRPPRVSGTVTDARTGEAIERFNLTPGEVISEADGGEYSWSPHLSKAVADGRFDEVLGIPFDTDRGLVVKVEAEGYAPAISEPFTVADGVVERDIALRTSVPVTGVVRGSDGNPVAGAEVFLTFSSGDFNFSYLEMLRQSPSKEQRAVTGPDGRYAFPPQLRPFGIAVVAEEGFARRWPSEMAESTDVTLVPWARIEGRYLVGDEPGAGVEVTVYINATTEASTGWVNYQFEATTDADGRFVLDRVASGHAVAFTPTVGPLSFEVEPGETAEVTIGGSGRPVVGSLSPPGDVSLPFGLDGARANLVLEQPPFPSAAEMGGADRIAFLARWYRTPEGRAWRLSNQGNPVRVEADGSFRAEDVRPGSYLLMVQLSSDDGTDPRADGERTEIQATLEHRVEVSEGDGLLDLGRLALEVEAVEHRMLPVGEPAPAFEVTTLDGDPLRLADLRGKVVLLDFWATWCAPCLAEEPDLRAAWDAFKDDDRFAMISLSLDDRAEDPLAHVRARGLGWTQGFLGPWSDSTVARDFGVEFIPEILLIGPDGLIAARGLRGGAIKAAVAEALGRE